MLRIQASLTERSHDVVLQSSPNKANLSEGHPRAPRHEVTNSWETKVKKKVVHPSRTPACDPHKISVKSLVLAIDCASPPSPPVSTNPSPHSCDSIARNRVWVRHRSSHEAHNGISSSLEVHASKDPRMWFLWLHGIR